MFFPLVGFCLGLILVLLDWALDPYLASEILSVVIVALLVLMTGAQQLEGLGRIFEKLCRRNLQDVVMSERYNRIGIISLLAVLVVIALKFRSIEVMGEVRSQGLLLAPLLARWAMVVLAYGSKSADEETGRIMPAHVRGGHLFLATIFSLSLVILFARRSGLWVALWVSLFALISRFYLHRRIGGVSGDSFGAMAEISETFALVLFASL